MLTHIERLLGQRVSLGFVLLEDGLNLEQGLCLESADPVREGDGAVHGSQGPCTSSRVHLHVDNIDISHCLKRNTLCRENSDVVHVWRGYDEVDGGRMQEELDSKERCATMD